MIKFEFNRQWHSTLSVFVFVAIAMKFTTCHGSTFSSTPNRFSRQLAFTGGGRYNTDPYSPTRQQSTEATFFQAMMSLNLDLGEVLAMYRNVTAVAETPGCFGHCRTPIALWVVQSFYPCYSLKKMDCPRGLVCCMQDPATRFTSANTLHVSRIRGSSAPHRPDDSATPVPNKPTESTTLFDEEWYKNNFIQDEIPE